MFELLEGILAIILTLVAGLVISFFLFWVPLGLLFVGIVHLLLVFPVYRSAAKSGRNGFKRGLMIGTTIVFSVSTIFAVRLLVTNQFEGP